MPEKPTSTEFDEYQIRVALLTEIGIALSSELHLDALLEKIVRYARELTNADAGTLYLLKGDNRLHFRILQNRSMNVYQGGTTGKRIDLDPVELNGSNVSAYAALEHKTVTVDDVYTSDEFDFSGPRHYDSITGYRTTSMLVVPMLNHEGEVIGILQLLNSIDPKTGDVVAFPRDVISLTEALASQAGVAYTNASLIREIKELFDGLIQVMAVAVDKKSSYTTNHVQRVARLNVLLARAINDCPDQPFADIHFSEKNMEEIRLSGWLHDVGKVTTPERVMDKGTKLEKLIDRIDLIKLRFALIGERIKNIGLQEKLKALGGGVENPDALEALDTTTAERLRHVKETLDFVARCNTPGEFMSDDKLEKLQQIAGWNYPGADGAHPYLEDDEVRNLSIRKGTLTPEEFKIIQDHVVLTRKMLERVPFPKHLKNVPIYAGQHHEKINGKGYPEGLKGDQIPVQSRILAIADIYEALSAKDRPYKKPMPVEKILAILGSMAEDGAIDKDILDLMVREKVHDAFEREYEEQKKVMETVAGLHQLKKQSSTPG